MEKENLIIEAAAKVHEDWCMQEYKGFWDRARQIYQSGEKDIVTVLNQACFKNNQKRNEIVIDMENISNSQTNLNNCIDDFNIFINLIKTGLINIKRFTKRNLTEEEQIKNIKSGNYNPETEEENILRNFNELSSDSKKENLEAAISAYTVFEQFSKACISIEQMLTDSKIRNMIGIAIHTDWLKRNKNHPNDSLKVSYDNLDDWIKQQDLTVFDALITVVKTNDIKVQKEEGYSLPDYLLEEQQVLEELKTKQI